MVALTESFVVFKQAGLVEDPTYVANGNEIGVFGRCSFTQVYDITLCPIIHVVCVSTYKTHNIVRLKWNVHLLM